MQVRDLIEQLKEYPEDWPVCYMAKNGTPVEMVLKRGEGSIGRIGENVDFCVSQQPFIGIKCASQYRPSLRLVSYKTRGQAKEENDKIRGPTEKEKEDIAKLDVSV